ncbi:23420_t:CDS:1 [Racocetra persica]|uniref:23420_t:CDS:1 n=1 Tax=Racocetra persica TaxID=160502 RepID=A0ACA9QEB3_9GLOM|nr:23420_t:CDS:1 [Racocetra persica]
MSYSFMTKSGEIQFPLNVSSEMGISKSLNENSFYNELFSRSPYPLTLEINDLISPPNSRKAMKYQQNPTLSPPRPQNAFVLFRRDFAAKLKQKEMKMKTGEISRLAAEEWHKQPQNVLCFFEFLENLAKEKHKLMYPDYKFLPKKRKEKSIKIIKVEHEKAQNSNATDNSSEMICFNAEEILNDMNCFSYDIPRYQNISKNTLLSEISDQSPDQENFDISDFIEFDPIIPRF